MKRGTARCLSFACGSLPSCRCTPCPPLRPLACNPPPPPFVQVYPLPDLPPAGGLGHQQQAALKQQVEQLNDIMRVGHVY